MKDSQRKLQYLEYDNLKIQSSYFEINSYFILGKILIRQNGYFSEMKEDSIEVEITIIIC